MAYYVSSGVTSTGITLYNDRMYISSGGVANSTTVKNLGSMYISSGGTATDIIWTPCVGDVSAADGACVTYASAYSGVYFGSNDQLLSHTQSMTGKVVSGSMYVMSNGVANSTTVNAWGNMYISSGGVANSTTVNSGDMYISSGGVANRTNVNYRGSMYIRSGGTATDIIWTPCVGDVSAADGACVTYASAYSGVYFGSNDQLLSHTQSMTGKVVSGSMYVMSNGVANSTTVNAWGNMYISSGGVANSTTVNSGYMYISSGGVANRTNVNYRGSMYIRSGGVANRTNVSWGGMYISSGGVANSTTVNSGGGMYISSGGTATNVVWTPCVGYVSAADGACVTYASAYSGVYFGSNNQLLSHTQSMTGKSVYGSMYVMSNGVANSTIVSNLGKMYIFPGGTANSTTVMSHGYMYIKAGGVANSTTVSWGSMYISSGGVANSTTVKSWGDMYISSGGVANSTTVNSSGYMYIKAGGVANSTTVNSSGYMYIKADGMANSTTVNSSGYMYISSGGTATDIVASAGARLGITVAPDTYIQGTYAGSAFEMKDAQITGYAVNSSGRMYISSGGVANSTTVNSGGGMYISSGGVANSTINDGHMYISSGGMANSTTVSSGGGMYISSGGVHRGCLQIAAGAVVSAYSGSVIDFTLTDRTTEDGYQINDLSRISGTSTYTITVSADQAAGEYKLAQGAEEFTGTITIGDGTTDYGNLTINGHYLQYSDKLYELKNQDGDLTLSIYSTATPGGLTGSVNGVSWDSSGYVKEYVVQYSYDNFDTAISLSASTTAVDTYNLPSESYLWQVKAFGGDWSTIRLIKSENAQIQPQLVESDQDGDLDLFFASANGRWSASYAAAHQGIKDIWGGTAEWVSLGGKNKLEDVFVGSSDAGILVLTDDANGDALFVDDVYSAFPDELAAQARIAQINEIRAGAGDDIVDLTSQQFVYIGDGVTVYGGLGNDVIWANSGDNQLFGDAGNDRIVGGSDNDIIVGGAGNDRMHGGGGSDTFCFGSDWGKDTIEQLADGSVTLWFESGSEDFWNAEALIYTDGVNKVIIKGVTADAVSLRFGDVETAIAGAFENAASEKIYEDQDKALIA